MQTQDSKPLTYKCPVLQENPLFDGVFVEKRFIELNGDGGEIVSLPIAKKSGDVVVGGL